MRQDERPRFNSNQETSRARTMAAEDRMAAGAIAVEKLSASPASTKYSTTVSTARLTRLS